MALALCGIGWGSNQITPLLLVYGKTLGLGTGTLEALFGIYALGLIPALLLAGPVSDARGRRFVVLPAAGLSLLSTVVVVAGAHTVALLFAGRFMAGVASGMAFSAGTSWLREVSLPPLGCTDAQGAARRAAVAMTAGFGLGPLAAGLLAQWVPAPRILAYVPHLVVMALALPVLLGVPETVPPADRHPVTLRVPDVRLPRFRRVVAPLAPWVFATPAVAFALLPSILGAARATDGIALTAAVTSVTALAGVAIQPVARRLDTNSRRNRAAAIGLLVTAGGLVLAAATVHVDRLWLLVPSGVVLGSAYGLCLVAGLVEVQRLARPGNLAGLTAAYYAVTYVGFAAPYLLALASSVAGYPLLLLMTAGLAGATAASVTRRSGSPTPTAANQIGDHT
ncbi:MAG: MFS transporter [Acidimicrobiales bacterium]